MYILCKRSAPNEHGQIQQHSIHGKTENPSVARAWFRAAYSTDVVEVSDPFIIGSETVRDIGGDAMQDWSIEQDLDISAKRFSSWREQQLAAEKVRP